MKTYIVIKDQFSGLHQWSDCNVPEVMYLKYPHRHLFHVTVKFKVVHDNRDIEFIKMKNALHSYLQQNYEAQDLGNKSCEMLCVDIFSFFRDFGVVFVSIFEDNENGAEVHDE